MAQSIAELMELGLSKAEAERVINRRAKAEAESAKSKAVAEKRLPKIQADLDHAVERAKLWSGRVDELQAKLDKYNGILGVPNEVESADEPKAEVKPITSGKGRKRA